MSSSLCSLVLVAGLCHGADDKPATSKTDSTMAVGYVPAQNSKDAKSIEAQPYVPKEGDMVFFDDHNPFWTVLFLWAGTGPSLHVGIVVKKEDGTLAVLEAGPDD